MATPRPSRPASPAAPAASLPERPVAPPPVRVYLAGPLFTLQERRLNRELALAVQRAWPELEIVLPQDFKPHGKFNDARAFGALFQNCLDSIRASHALLAWLDGPDTDSGTCFEAGYAYALGLPVIGFRTDFRNNQERGLNIMLSRSCTAFVYRPSFDEDLDALARDLARALRKALKREEGKTE